MRAEYKKYSLIFKEVAITSRNTLHTKDTYFIKVWDDENPTLFGVGEISLFRGLSAEPRSQSSSGRSNNRNHMSEIPIASR